MRPVGHDPDTCPMRTACHDPDNGLLGHDVDTAMITAVGNVPSTDLAYVRRRESTMKNMSVTSDIR
jgi:hypothetical protein